MIILVKNTAIVTWPCGYYLSLVLPPLLGGVPPTAVPGGLFLAFTTLQATKPTNAASATQPRTGILAKLSISFSYVYGLRLIFISNGTHSSFDHVFL